MDKLFFKVGDEYKVCSKCKALAAAKLKRCDECRTLLPTKFTIFTQEDYDAVREGNTPVSIHNLEEEYTQKCSDCGKLFTYEASNCDTPDCKGVLMPYFMEEDTKDTAETPKGTDNPYAKRQETEGKLRYYFEAYRYENGQKIKSNTDLFPIEERLLIGRFCLYNDERFFFRNLDNDKKRKIAEYYANIKREHCYLLQHDGKLFLQLTEDNASVRINGNKVRTMDEVQIHDTDELLIGSGDDRNRKILLVAKKAMVSQEAKSSSVILPDDVVKALSEEIKRELKGDMEEGFTRFKKDITELISSIKIEEIRRKDDEDDEEYVSRMLEVDEEDEKEADNGLSVEERIHNFLKIKDADGQIRDYFSEYQALKQRPQIVLQLRAVAKFEAIQLNSEDPDEDYSNLVIIIGKIVEEVIMVYLASICYEVFNPQFAEAIRRFQRENSKNLEMGFVVRYLLKGEGSSGKIWKIVRAAGLPDNQESFDHVKKLVKNLQYGADTRNQKGGHAPASKGANRRENLEEYVKNNSLTIFSKGEYLDFKRKVFGSEMFSSALELYDKICK